MSLSSPICQTCLFIAHISFSLLPLCLLPFLTELRKRQEEKNQPFSQVSPDLNANLLKQIQRALMLHKKIKGRGAASTAIRTDLYCFVTSRQWSKSQGSLKSKLSQRSPGCSRCLLSEPWKEGGKWQDLMVATAANRWLGWGSPLLSSTLSMQRVFAVVKQRGCKAWALQLLRTPREYFCFRFEVFAR